MTRVAPAAAARSASSPPARVASGYGYGGGGCGALLGAIEARFVLHGASSVERLLALRDYSERTSKARAAAICLLTPLPALLLTLAIELLPLDAPSDRWSEQRAFWSRQFVVSTVMFLLAAVGFKHLAGRELRVELWRVLAAGLLTAALHTALMIGLAALWTFPVPFLIVLGALPYVICQLLSVFVVMDVKALLSKTKNLQQRMNAINSSSSAVCIMYLAYPMFNAAFRSVDKEYQLPMLLTLPVFKFGWKKWTQPKLTEIEDLVPTIMMFTIELFNALYLAACMQKSGSPTTTAVITLFDFALGFRRVKRLHHRTRELLQTIHESIQSSGNANFDLLNFFISRITRLKSPINKGLLRSVRVQGNGLEYNLSTASTKLIRELAEASLKNDADKITVIRRGSSTDDGKIVLQTLQMIFYCEFMVLGEYFECAIPIVYMVYLPLLKNMRNCVYYGHIWSLSRIDLINVALNIGAYSLFKCVSFAILLLWLQRKFMFSPLHLLAFVLDEHMMYVQCNAMTQIQYALQYTIAHLGADFSFRFAWMKDPSVKWWITR